LFAVFERFCRGSLSSGCTDKKENKIILIYKEIQLGRVAKSYLRKGFLIVIYEEMHKYSTTYMRPLVIYDFATEFPYM
jgi:hypothetical protein